MEHQPRWKKPGRGVEHGHPYYFVGAASTSGRPWIVEKSWRPWLHLRHGLHPHPHEPHELLMSLMSFEMCNLSALSRERRGQRGAQLFGLSHPALRCVQGERYELQPAVTLALQCPKPRGFTRTSKTPKEERCSPVSPAKVAKQCVHSHEHMEVDM